MATRTVRLLAPVSTGANPITRLSEEVHGRVYTVAANGYLDVLAPDADRLEANGWQRCARFSGTTSQRPAPSDPDMLGGTLRDMTFFDSTLGYIVINDGVGNWRNPATGAAV